MKKILLLAALLLALLVQAMAQEGDDLGKGSCFHNRKDIKMEIFQ